MLTIYKASAGSGKTFTLTLEYIKMLLGRKNNSTGEYELVVKRDNSHNSILAVTFTNKATEEMKRRIVKELSILANTPCDSGYIDSLRSHFQCDDVDKIARASLNALYSLLFRYSYFNVSTIDSFFQQVLRTFANEIDRPGNFDIEMDEEYTLGQGISSLLDSVSTRTGNNPVSIDYLKKWLKTFMTDMVDNGRSFNIFNRGSSLHSGLVKTMQRLLDENYRLNSEKINRYLDNPNTLIAFNKALEAEIAKILSQRAADAENFSRAVSGSIYEPFCKIPAKWIAERLSHKPGDDLSKTLAGAAVEPSSAFKKTTKTTKGKCPELPESLLQLVVSMFGRYQEQQNRLKSLMVIKSQLFYMGLLGLLVKAVGDYCRDNNMILISDTNELINRIIGGNITPFIYERMGVRLHHFLIDEFQDTSRMQWGNFTPLLLESMSHGHDNLIIGDEKQCIYRFRNSEPELLGHEVEEYIGSRFPDVDNRGLCIEENCNWRSAREIVMFNNSLFYSMGRLPQFTADNACRNVIQGLPDKHADFHGYVEVNFIDGMAKEDSNNIAIEKTLTHLKRLLTVYSPGDIAILVRVNDQARMIVDAMLAAMQPGNNDEPPLLPEFEIISNQALAIESSQAVRLVVNIMKLVDVPENVDRASESLRDRRYKSQVDMTRLQHRYEIFMAGGDDSDTALRRAADDEEYTDSLLAIAMDKDCDDISGVVDRIIEKLPDDLRSRETLFLTAFQDLVLNFMQRNGGDLHSFLNWWNLTGHNSTIDSPSSTDALTVTTIHKSKGIEYRCVIVPFANWSFAEDSSAAKQLISWHKCRPIEGIPDELIPEFIPLEKVSKLRDTVFADDYEADNIKQRIDAMNITYVAFTRAVEELVVISEFPANTNRESVAEYLRTAILQATDTDYEHLRRILPANAYEWITPLAGYYEEETATFSIGQPRTLACEAKKDAESATAMPSYMSYDNSDLLKVVKVERDEDFDPENARVAGNFMHSVMSSVVGIEDLEYACRLRAEQVGLSADTMEERLVLLRDALQNETVRPWFCDTERVLTERQISLGDNRTIRPDRVVWTADGHIDIIDYKFGEVHDPKYIRQVQGYVNAMRDAGYSNVRGFLWYPLDNEIIRI